MRWHRMQRAEKKAAFESLTAQPWHLRWTAWFLVVMLTSLIGVLGVLVALLSAFGVPFLFGGLALMPVIAGLSPLWSIELCRFGPYFGWIAERRVGQGLCGACTYSMSGVRRDSEGLSCCPECGAAWKLPSPDADAK